MSSCLSPIWLSARNMFVPCGKCYNCVTQRRNSWTFRLVCESFQHKYSSFLTLTYADEYLPLNSLGVPTLVVDHLNKFFKDIRNDKFKIKYYAIGEYGGRFGRPHYHAIVFYDDEIWFNNYWHNGNLHEGSVSPASIHYVSKFHMYPKASGVRSDFTQPPFARMSKFLGFDWFKNFVDVKTGEILSDLPDFVLFNGYSYPVPRYYRKLFALPPMEFEFTIDKLIRKYGNLQRAYQALATMQEIAEKKLQKYNNNSNLI